jgi:hypothetical protein
MGLLDDAIREHLELKRRRGADPAEVAREQQEVLAADSDDAVSGDLDASTEEHALEVGPSRGEDRAAGEHALEASAGASAFAEPVPVDTPELPPEEDGANLEETAELDMNAVLEDEHTADAENAERAPHETEQPEQLDSAAAAESPSRAHGSAGQENAQSRPVVDEGSELIGEIPEQERMRFEQQPSESSGLER